MASYLDEVLETQDSLIINRFGKPVAIISPYEKSSGTDALSYFGFLGKDGIAGKKFLAKVRRNKKERERTRKLRGK